MRRLVPLFLLAVFPVVPACYHARVETGLEPSPQVIEKSFASGWIYGLVPPSTVEAASKCPSGVSKVETQLSFVNQLVAFLTAYIYTPMNIKVTCAARGRSSLRHGASEIYVGANATPGEVEDALNRAAGIALKSRGPVYLVKR